MINTRFFLFLFGIFFFSVLSYGQSIHLVEGGQSDYVIVIPQEADAVENRAAEVLQEYIHRVTEVVISIQSSSEQSGEHKIFIGRNSVDKRSRVSIEDLQEDGFLIKTSGRQLLIVGKGRGTLFGVYHFLEKELGCKKYAPREPAYVPQRKNIILEKIDEKENPAFAYRVNFYRDVFNDREYQDWHGLDNNENNDRYPGSGRSWGLFVHTFDRLLSSKEYGDSHPEYFSFYDGKRHPGYNAHGQPISQLDLSNPEVLEIVTQNLRKEISKNPAALYWSVSQNDNINYCRDSACRKLDARYASLLGQGETESYGNRYSMTGSGSILNFVNQVADRFPEKVISTLAYQYSRRPPKGLKPRKNVNIMLCNIESPRNIPFPVGDSAFTQDLEGWNRLTHHIILWDYVVQFSNLLAPFPNLRTLQPNLQYLQDKKIQMIFSEGNPEMGGEFSALRAYLISKLLWNPDLDFSKVMDDFLNGYYGQAAQPIKKHLDLLHDQMEESGARLSIFGNPVEENKTFLTDSLLLVSDQLFNQAENRVSQDSILLERVRTARLSIDYAWLEIARDRKDDVNGAFFKTDGGALLPNQRLVHRLHRFVQKCKQDGLVHLKEGYLSPDEYLNDYEEFLSQSNPTSAL